MSHYHAVVWLDHERARIHHFNTDENEARTIEAEGPNSLIQRQDKTHDPGPRTGKKTAEDRRYYEAIVKALEGAQTWLIMGPGLAKKELQRHVEEHEKRFVERIAAVEAADHPSDGEILDRARTFFRALDRMTPQTGEAGERVKRAS
jgi:stalled ribosome rescue protein Dom34